MVFTLRHRRHVGGRLTKGRSLARFVCLPAFVHFTIVICVSQDCMKTTYTLGRFELTRLITITYNESSPNGHSRMRTVLLTATFTKPRCS